MAKRRLLHSILLVLSLSVLAACQASTACSDPAGCARILPGQALTIGLPLPESALDCPAREEILRAATLALIDYGPVQSHPTQLAIVGISSSQVGDPALAQALNQPSLAASTLPSCSSKRFAVEKALSDAAVPYFSSAPTLADANAVGAALEAAFPSRRWWIILPPDDLFVAQARAICAAHPGSGCEFLAPSGELRGPLNPAAGDVLLVITTPAHPWPLLPMDAAGAEWAVWDPTSVQPFIPALANTSVYSVSAHPAGWDDFSARYYRQYGQPVSSPDALSSYQDMLRLLDLVNDSARPAENGLLVPRQFLSRQFAAQSETRTESGAQIFLTLNGHLFHGDN